MKRRKWISGKSREGFHLANNGTSQAAELTDTFLSGLNKFFKMFFVHENNKNISPTIRRKK